MPPQEIQTITKRRLPTRMSDKQRQILNAVYEWFGKMNPLEGKSARKIALSLMRRRKNIELTEEEKSITWMIRQNLGWLMN